MKANQTTQSSHAVLETVRGVLRELLERQGVRDAQIEPETSVFDDLGVDSLMLVDLTILLEERLSLEEFPVQAWVDSEALVQGTRYTVASIVRLCGELVRS